MRVLNFVKVQNSDADMQMPDERLRAVIRCETEPKLSASTRNVKISQ